MGAGRGRTSVAVVGGGPLLSAVGVRQRRATVSRRDAVPRRPAAKRELLPPLICRKRQSSPRFLRRRLHRRERPVEFLQRRIPPRRVLVPDSLLRLLQAFVCLL